MEQIELYYNFTLPDILFLHQSRPETMVLPDNLQPDLILTECDSHKPHVDGDAVPILCLGDDTRDLFLKVCECLS